MAESLEMYEKEAMVHNSDQQPSQSDLVARKIIKIEYISIGAVTVCLVVSLILAYQDRSASAMALAVDSLLDILSYTVILWRFSGKEKNSHGKEKHTLIALGTLFIISGFIVECESISDYMKVVKPRPSKGFIFINLVQGAMFTAIGVYKLKLSQETPLGNSLLSDGVNSIISALDCFSMSVSMTIFVTNRNVWYLDSMFGIIIGLFIIAYGCYLFFQVRSQRNQSEFTQLD
jgi:divalent metal cation (Fe/Co/Zn/Cd) transporter